MGFCFVLFFDYKLACMNFLEHVFFKSCYFVGIKHETIYIITRTLPFRCPLLGRGPAQGMQPIKFDKAITKTPPLSHPFPGPNQNKDPPIFQTYEDKINHPTGSSMILK